MSDHHSDTPTAITPGDDEILFLPLGGTGEIGMNLTLYGHAGSWIIVDLGITFGNDAFPQYDVMMADPAFITARREQLAGIVLTHGHEDHVGALPYLWPQLKCPVYATPFTAALARHKLAQAGISDAPIIEVALDGRVQVGPFEVRYLTMTHSIPEPNGLLLRTPAGNLFHTGDWKLDPRPVIGTGYDRDSYRALQHEPVAAMICDSTNAVTPGATGSEGALFKPLCELTEQAPGRVLVTTFASNVARLVTLARVAQHIGRRFGVIGQAMERMVALARATGYWPDDLPDLVDDRHLGYLPPEEVFAACTGSQGEPRAALSRFARDRHPAMLLEPGDLVIFSSKKIPGNERAVEQVQRQLQGLGARLITDEDAPVHVSGHPCQDDLRRLYGWVQPAAVIPVHGTPRHLDANATIASACGVPLTRVVENGALCRITPADVRVLQTVPTGRLHLRGDGKLSPVPAEPLARMRAGAS